MGWRDLLPEKDESIVLPWTGGSSLHAPHRTFKLKRAPRHFGWYRFKFDGRGNAYDPVSDDPREEILKHFVAGYLVGDRLVPDNVIRHDEPSKIVEQSEKVFLIDEGLDRFVRIVAGRVYPEGPLIFSDEDFPMGPEAEVTDAFLDRKESVSHISGVVPALDAAFRMESFRREEAVKRRAELESKRAEELAKIEQDRKREEILEKLGDGAGRREMAKVNFAEAAEAALKVGGAIYLDHRTLSRGEFAVKYSVDGQRIECTCDENLHIVDSGVCLTDERTGEKGDGYFTLESLPSVIRQAVREDRLVIYRHI